MEEEITIPNLINDLMKCIRTGHKEFLKKTITMLQLTIDLNNYKASKECPLIVSYHDSLENELKNCINKLLKNAEKVEIDEDMVVYLTKENKIAIQITDNSSKTLYIFNTY